MARCSECGQSAGFKRTVCADCEQRARDRKAVQDAGLADVQPWMLPRRHRVNRVAPTEQRVAQAQAQPPFDVGLAISRGLIMLGAVGLVFALFIMNVSVDTGDGGRVVNFELMSRRQLYVIASGVLLIAGVILIVSSSRSEKS